MIKKLLGEWLEERRLSQRPPLPQDATIYTMAFVEWADKKAAAELARLRRIEAAAREVVACHSKVDAENTSLYLRDKTLEQLAAALAAESDAS